MLPPLFLSLLAFLPLAIDDGYIPFLVVSVNLAAWEDMVQIVP